MEGKKSKTISKIGRRSSFFKFPQTISKHGIKLKNKVYKIKY